MNWPPSPVTPPTTRCRTSGSLSPSLVHDAHDASLAAADAWLEQQLTPVLKSTDFTSGKLVVVVTADEDDKHSGNVVLTSVLTPRIPTRS